MIVGMATNFFTTSGVVSGLARQGAELRANISLYLQS